jgi:hypothetical protein
MDNSDQRRSATKDLQAISPNRMLRTEKRCRGHYHRVDLTMNLGFCPEATPSTTRERGSLLGEPTWRNMTPMGTGDTGQTKVRREFHLHCHHHRASEYWEKNCPCSLTPPLPQLLVVVVTKSWSSPTFCAAQGTTNNRYRVAPSRPSTVEALRPKSAPKWAQIWPATPPPGPPAPAASIYATSAASTTPMPPSGAQRQQINRGATISSFMARAGPRRCLVLAPPHQAPTPPDPVPHACPPLRLPLKQRCSCYSHPSCATALPPLPCAALVDASPRAQEACRGVPFSPAAFDSQAPPPPPAAASGSVG